MAEPTAAPGLYATRPDLYDLMHSEYVDDARFIEEFVATLGPQPRVLELGCGTGRLLAPLLDAGARVTGIDAEPAMLAVARQRLTTYGDRLQLVQGDMRRFRIAERFELAVVGLNTFMHMLEQRDQLECLACIHAHLRPAGLLLIDLASPYTALRDTVLGMLQHRFTRPSCGGRTDTTTLWSVTSTTLHEQRAHDTLFFDEVDGESGSIRRTVVEVALRLTYRYELELLLGRSGFAIRALYGGYDSAPYEDESDRLICLAAALA